MKNKYAYKIICLFLAVILLSGCRKFMFTFPVRHEALPGNITAVKQEANKSAPSAAEHPALIQKTKPQEIKLMLLATMQGEDKEQFCMLKDLRTGIKALYKIGDIVQGAKVVMIYPSYIKVLLFADNREELIQLSSEYPAEELIQKVSEEELLVKKEKIPEYLPQVNALLNVVKIAPKITDGKIDGLRISHIPQESIIEKAGLKNNDVIKTVAGFRLDALSSAPMIIREVQNKQKVKVEIERDGRIIELTYLMP